jgi:hypothetical protein
LPGVTNQPVFNRACPVAVSVNGTGETRSRAFLKCCASRLFIFSLLALLGLVGPASGSRAAVLSDANPMAMPAIGDHGLRAISPTVLEVTLINTKVSHPAHVSAWDFVNEQGVLSLPALTQFVVTANGLPVVVQSVGFKRRPLHAPEQPGGLRIASHFYLKLATSLADGASVEVKNPTGTLWGSSMVFATTMDPLRRSPAVHVNQVGYMPNYPKKAMVGYYLGTMGELPVPATAGFKLLDAATRNPVFTGTLKLRAEYGFATATKPYQQVYEADFTSYQTPGEYVLQVPDLGTSLPFRINGGITANFARTFALGLFHQRCGGPTALPFTRHTHPDCHTAAADVPTMDPAFAKTQEFLSSVSSDYKSGDWGPRHTAPQLSNVAASLYPFQRQGKVDVRGGHHDAGDYSKYTINSANLVHFLVFAADSFAGVGALDNLGLPESGDGKSDILQEAKWEADFLAKLQDTDGGFYFLVYPKDQRYENRVLPHNGLPQVVWPKTTAVTAAAVAALAEAGSSPLMKAQFPAEAAIYLQKAQLGWTFLTNAIATHGKDGSYQKSTHYGHEFMHDDELAWAAAAMFAATGEAQYHQKLIEFFPNPNAAATRRWTWWKLFEGYGNAVRTYAFAARSGRRAATDLDTNYLARCTSEIMAAADDHARFSQQSAYGTSFPEANKAQGTAGWYFSSERAFDVTVAYQLQAKSNYLETVVANINFEGGSNPLDMTYITGIGSKRQRDIVHQYAWNDHRILPPAGIPLGNVQANYGYLETYTMPVTVTVNGEPRTNWVNSLPYLSFPNDAITGPSPYSFYDRWTDMINTMTEFVVMDQARSLASLAFWMAQGANKTQPWQPVLGQIVGIDAGIEAGKPATISMTAPGIDLSEAQVVWEIRYLDPLIGNPATFTPKFSGDHWVEAEALLPDGRRIVAVSNFVASTSIDAAPNSYQSAPLAVSPDMAALYHADGNTSDATTKRPALTLIGNAKLDSSNLGWMTSRAGSALRFLDLGDEATVKIPVSALAINSTTTAIVLEAMIYVNEFKAYDRDVARILSMQENDWNAYVELIEDKYGGPFIKGGTTLSFTKPELTAALTAKTWHHLSLAVTRTGYVIKLNGEIVASVPSADFANWGKSQTVTLTMGNFDGWIDEVAVRSVKTSTTGNATLTPLGAGTGGFRMRIAGQTGSIYRIEASADNRTWTSAGTVTLSTSSAEFTDPATPGHHRFYRAVKQ